MRRSLFPLPPRSVQGPARAANPYQPLPSCNINGRSLRCCGGLPLIGCLGWLDFGGIGGCWVFPADWLL